MKKILIVSNSVPGLISFRFELIESLSKNHNVTVIAPYSKRVDKLLETGCKYNRIDIERHGQNIIKELKLIYSFKQIIKELNPDFVLTYTIKPNIYVGLITMFNSKINQIANITGLGNSIMNNKNSIVSKFMLKFYAFSIVNASKVFVQNKQIFSMMKTTNKKLELDLLPGSGVNTRKFSYQEMIFNGYERVVTFLGRVIEEKGIFELYDAIEKLNRKNTNYKYKFYIVGRNSLELPECENITVSNSVSDVRTILATSHVIINPSYHEGMSNVLLEAASSGRMIMGSNIYGSKEIIGDMGILFEPRNSNSIYEAFLFLDKLSNEELILRGKRLRKHVVEEFSRNIVIKKYSDVIEGEKNERFSN